MIGAATGRVSASAASRRINATFAQVIPIEELEDDGRSVEGGGGKTSVLLLVPHDSGWPDVPDIRSIIDVRDNAEARSGSKLV